ncbi:protein EMBRYO DEFECTIVE 514-like [Phragmites australis]|uniref:protein EMBRYO DEFECTIVE 514-like n=1 Tax=Phragmites australis TaxID=29695 RepID=UPI002D789A5E|nr:protein EMBRYO DEFECTIVE 514-like [Phragmites australis]
MAEPEVAVAAAAAMETEAPAAAGLKREREEVGDPAAEGGKAATEESAAAKKPKVEGEVKVEKEREDGKGEEAEGKAVNLGPKEFASAVEMFDYFFALLHSWTPQLDFNKYEQMVLEDLLKKGHAEPTKKIGPGVEAFEIRNHPVWQSRCFFVRRVDGSADDFSFRKCVDNILPLPEDMKIGNGKKSGGHHKGGGGRGGRGRGRGGGRGGRGRDRRGD